MIKNLFSSFLLLGISMSLIGLYTVTIYLVGQNFWTEHANGSLIIDNQQQIRGSLLIAQETKSAIYFTGRITEKVNNSCDVALYNEKLKTTLLQRYKDAGKPYDVSSLTPSSSLLDPYITKREAIHQAKKIALARNVPLKHLLKLIELYTLDKSTPFFDLEIINTTLLNSILDGYIVKIVS